MRRRWPCIDLSARADGGWSSPDRTRTPWKIIACSRISPKPDPSGRKPRRSIAGRMSVTEILALHKNGAQRTRYDRDVSLSRCAWNGIEWELEGVYGSRDAVRRSASGEGAAVRGECSTTTCRGWRRGSRSKGRRAAHGQRVSAQSDQPRQSAMVCVTMIALSREMSDAMSQDASTIDDLVNFSPLRPRRMARTRHRCRGAARRALPRRERHQQRRDRLDDAATAQRRRADNTVGGRLDRGSRPRLRHRRRHTRLHHRQSRSSTVASLGVFRFPG